MAAIYPGLRRVGRKHRALLGQVVRTVFETLRLGFGGPVAIAIDERNAFVEIGKPDLDRD